MTRDIRIYGVPMDLGQRRRGVDMGPSALRYAGLQARLQRIGLTVNDSGNIRVPVYEEIARDDDERAHNADAISQVCREAYALMIESVGRDEFAIFLGGDHSMSMGTVAGSLARDARVGVLWVDAHGDFNTPQTTPSGNVHGMVVAALMGLCPPPLRFGTKLLTAQQIAFIGVRDLDAEEKQATARHNLAIYTMRDIDEDGMASVVRQALDSIGDVDVLHVSLDMDSLDPSLAPGVGTPVPGGLTYREAHLLMEMLADDGRVRALDIVEVNPILDSGNTTSKVAIELTASLLGLRIR
ncbi:MAG: arginase [Chloroflexota bacterium]|nr:arginase [Chloroflexota bacterium]